MNHLTLCCLAIAAALAPATAQVSQNMTGQTDRGTALFGILSSTLAEGQSCRSGVRARTEFADFAQRLPFNSNQATPEQLADRSRLAADRQAAFKRYATEIRGCQDAIIAGLSPHLPAAAAAYRQAILTAEQVQARLIANQLSWGELVTEGTRNAPTFRASMTAATQQDLAPPR